MYLTSSRPIPTTYHSKVAPALLSAIFEGKDKPERVIDL
jgi:hypothetical protein